MPFAYHCARRRSPTKVGPYGWSTLRGLAWWVDRDPVHRRARWAWMMEEQSGWLFCPICAVHFHGECQRDPPLTSSRSALDWILARERAVARRALDAGEQTEADWMHAGPLRTWSTDDWRRHLDQVMRSPSMRFRWATGALLWWSIQWSVLPATLSRSSQETLWQLLLGWRPLLRWSVMPELCVNIGSNEWKAMWKRVMIEYWQRWLPDAWRSRVSIGLLERWWRSISTHTRWLLS